MGLIFQLLFSLSLLLGFFFLYSKAKYIQTHLLLDGSHYNLAPWCVYVYMKQHYCVDYFPLAPSFNETKCALYALKALDEATHTDQSHTVKR